MKSIMQFLSVPLAVIGLIMALVFSESVAAGSIPFPVAVIMTIALVVLEFTAFYKLSVKEEKKDEENPDE